MTVKVLQGLNLRYPVTTVIAEMTAAKPDLLDFVKKLHPVFMVDYKIQEGKTLEVQTRLPNVWKKPIILQPIEDFSTGVLPLNEAKSKILEVLKLLVSSMSSIPILQAAHEMKYETIPVFVDYDEVLPKKLMNKYYRIGIGGEGGVIAAASTTGNSLLSFKTQRDKWYSNQFISTLGIPLASWRHVSSKEDLPKIAEELGFPLVIKPVGLTGGHAVKVGVKSLRELESGYDEIKAYVKEKPALKAWQSEIIVQKIVTGNDYRVLVINNKVEIATHRVPARVTGDGTHTIQQLIDLENQNPARDTSLPTHTLKPIRVDETLTGIIKEQGFTLESIPSKDQIVQVRKVASMSQGGITIDVTEQLNPQMRLICESIAASLHVDILGIDIICQDITKPLTPDNGSIIEMNTMPEIYLNAFPVIGKQYPDIGRKVVESLTAGRRTQTACFLGNYDIKTISSTVEENLGSAVHTGVFSAGKIFIDGQLIIEGLDIEHGVLAMKRNRLLDRIVLHYAEMKDLEEHGFGLDRIDLLVTNIKSEIDLAKYSQKFVAQ